MAGRWYASVFDLKATAAATVVGLSAAVTYRYAIKPAMRLYEPAKPPPQPPAAPPVLLPNSPPPEVLPTPPPTGAVVSTLDSNVALERLGMGRTVLLMARGYDAGSVAAARAAFDAAVRTLAASAAASGDVMGDVQYFVVDDGAAEAPAATLTARLGLLLDKPFVVVLDRFVLTERKYLMPKNEIPSAGGIVRFVTDWHAGKLKPARLGQPRPPGDRADRFPYLYEVVTDSFDDVVLGTDEVVLLEGYSSKCDACKALAPRLRMLAFLANKYWPGQLRVARMNILDNDRPLEWMPEVGVALLCSWRGIDGHSYSRGVLPTRADK